MKPTNWTRRYTQDQFPWEDKKEEAAAAAASQSYGSRCNLLEGDSGTRGGGGGESLWSAYAYIRGKAVERDTSIKTVNRFLLKQTALSRERAKI